MVALSVYINNQKWGILVVVAAAIGLICACVICY